MNRSTRFRRIVDIAVELFCRPRPRYARQLWTHFKKKKTVYNSSARDGKKITRQ